jgi:hypothetical protein
MVLIFSNYANTSKQIRREVERAVNKGIPIIPFRIENVLPSKALEYFISTPHWLDALTPPLERYLRQLTASVKALLEAKPGVAVSGQVEARGRPARSIFEGLSALGFPDSIRAIIIAISGILTLAPYLGGITIWSFGPTPMLLPTVPAGAIWPLVLLAPFWWCLLAVRIVGAPARRLAGYLAACLAVSIGSAVIYASFPGIALAAMTPNFNQTFQFGFIEYQHSWIASHERDGQGDKYCHFRTPARAFAAPVQRGCTLRVDKLSFDAGGYAAIPDRSAFDIELYVGTGPMLAETTECVAANNWPTVRNHPVGAEVALHGTIEVLKTQLKAAGGANYSLAFDYRNHAATASPTLATGTVPDASRSDLAIKDAAQFQISGWTLWGDPSRFQLDVINVTVEGRLFCGLSAMIPSRE